MAQMLLYAGANVKAATRLGGLTPLWMAAQNGSAKMADLLLGRGADANVATSLGVTPLMMAAASGSVDAIKTLAAHGGNVNAGENTYGQTPLMFAAATGQPAAIEALIELGAKTTSATKSRMPPARPPRGAPPAGTAGNPAAVNTGRGGRDGAPAPAQAAAAPPDQPVPGTPEESSDAQEPMGGLTPLLYASRQGHRDAVRALLDRGADINGVSADKTSPLMMAVINGHFDLAMYLLERGADPRIATMAGGTPLYRSVDLQWAPKSFYPQPSTKQEKVTVPRADEGAARPRRGSQRAADQAALVHRLRIRARRRGRGGRDPLLAGGTSRQTSMRCGCSFQPAPIQTSRRPRA